MADCKNCKNTYNSKLSLIDYIYRAENNLQIPKCYCLSSETEIAIVVLILKEYQRFITQKYFNNYLTPPKFKKISGEQYFMYKLCLMLDDHECDSHYLGHDMYAKRISYTEYGTWGQVNYDATYSLSNFGLVYHKLHYITYMFCMNDAVLNESGDFSGAEFIKKIIDSKQISISKYN